MRGATVVPLIALAAHCSASIFAVDYSPCHLCSSTFSEGHMYASGAGPLSALAGLAPALAARTNGGSTITARLRVTPPSGAAAVGSSALQLAVAFYRVPEGVAHAASMPDVCMASMPALRQDLKQRFGITALVRTLTPVDGKGHTTAVPPPYAVSESGRQFVRVALCGLGPAATGVVRPGGGAGGSGAGSAHGEQARVMGSIAFRNPYGFLPAIIFGLLPFQAALLLGFWTLAAFFAWHMRQHESQVLPLHRAILAVLLLSGVECALWTAGFVEMNVAGTPNCCPYPPLLMIAAVAQMLRKTLCRVLLLVVALGVGMVFRGLKRCQTAGVTLLAAVYFGVGLVAKVQEMTQTDEDARSGAPLGLSPWAKAEWGANVSFVLWIFVALDSIREDLAVTNQTAKLAMYSTLATILGVFTLLFSLLTFTFIAIQQGRITWPWQWQWAFVGMGVSDDGAFWHLLDFAVLFTYCIVWRPSSNSSQYSFAVQLPSSDEQADAVEAGIEMAVQEHGEHFSEEFSGTTAEGDDSVGGAGADADATADESGLELDYDDSDLQFADFGGGDGAGDGAGDGGSPRAHGAELDAELDMDLGDSGGGGDGSDDDDAAMKASLETYLDDDGGEMERV